MRSKNRATRETRDLAAFSRTRPIDFATPSGSGETASHNRTLRDEVSEAHRVLEHNAVVRAQRHVFDQRDAVWPEPHGQGGRLESRPCESSGAMNALID